ncbi:type II toxin-antitoxin system HipA family toxin [Patulibacter minatonensis]|uniref:type II toxin-antitoxin system HipA family toxin n=1 Tax=Patulibacter minatonensis TaxID=298163 RepID=UPI00047A1B18|nr:HipA domain-containing protein [Patulibacter minatonensis]
MTSEAYVWAWLPGATEPVPVGVARERGPLVEFAYGSRYLQRADAMALWDEELPLRGGFQEPLPGLQIAGCLSDAGPDSWGRRVILNRLAGRDADFDALSPLTYLTAAGPDRIGALDFQPSPREYVPRGSPSASLGDLLEMVENVEMGRPVPAALEDAVRAGSSVGGARPKALLRDGPRSLIAKFSAPTDTWPMVRGEFLAMRMAARCGLDVAEVELERVADRDVLLVERFDRVPGTTQRRAVVSALTLLQIGEMWPAAAAYGDLAELMRRRFSAPRESRRELFSRMVFNVLCGNTDDHARNHAAFWDGRELTLTPAYDICPFLRSGGEASQAMRLGTGEDPGRLSNVGECVARADLYGLTRDDALEIAHAQLDTIRAAWDEACDEARLATTERRLLGRVFPHEYALYDLEG